MVGWKIGSEVVYLAEGNAADTGTAVKWAEKLGESYDNSSADCSFFFFILFVADS